MTHLSSLSLSVPSAAPGPHFVAVNNKNEIVVTDFHNHSVKVWLGDAVVGILLWMYYSKLLSVISTIWFHGIHCK